MNDLAMRTTVRQMCTAFAKAEAEVRACFARLVQAEDELNTVFTVGAGGRIRIQADRDRYSQFNDADAAVARMAREAWQQVVDRAELRSMMSVAKCKELDSHLYDDKKPLPPFTEENVMNFLLGHMASARDMLLDAVVEVFDWLRPRANTRAGRLKTNDQVEVGERVILTRTVHKQWFSKRFTLDVRDRPHFTALENVFNGLAGQGTIAKNAFPAIETAIELSETGEGETDLLAFKCCLNGNLHLRFKRLDLLARFNQIAGGRRLRPAAA